MWRRSTLDTARVQDAAEVLSPDCHATTTDGIAIFKENQKLMRGVFSEVLQTNRGKKYARDHEGDYNAQSVHEKLITFCTKSTKSCANASNALS